MIIESHSLSFHIFTFISDWVLFFGANLPFILEIFFGFSAVGLLLSVFFYHKNRL